MYTASARVAEPFAAHLWRPLNAIARHVNHNTAGGISATHQGVLGPRISVIAYGTAPHVFAGAVVAPRVH